MSPPQADWPEMTADFAGDEVNKKKYPLPPLSTSQFSCCLDAEKP